MDKPNPDTVTTGQYRDLAFPNMDIIVSAYVQAMSNKAIWEVLP